MVAVSWLCSDEIHSRRINLPHVPIDLVLPDLLGSHVVASCSSGELSAENVTISWSLSSLLATKVESTVIVSTMPDNMPNRPTRRYQGYYHSTLLHQKAFTVDLQEVMENLYWLCIYI